LNTPTLQATGQANDSIIKVMLIKDGEMSRAEIQKNIMIET